MGRSSFPNNGSGIHMYDKRRAKQRRVMKVSCPSYRVMKVARLTSDRPQPRQSATLFLSCCFLLLLRVVAPLLAPFFHTHLEKLQLFVTANHNNNTAVFFRRSFTIVEYEKLDCSPMGQRKSNVLRKFPDNYITKSTRR